MIGKEVRDFQRLPRFPFALAAHVDFVAVGQPGVGEQKPGLAKGGQRRGNGPLEPRQVPVGGQRTAEFLEPLPRLLFRQTPIALGPREEIRPDFKVLRREAVELHGVENLIGGVGH